jgi:hypothetical protein
MLLPTPQLPSLQVRHGKLGSNRQELSPQMREAILQKWREVILPATGFETYEEMRASINQELGRPFKSAQSQ